MKFWPGQEFEHDGVQYRVLVGDRCEDDMVLEFRVAGWHRPKIAHSLIAVEFKFQVEENNYGRHGKIKRGGRGGWMLIDAIKEACRYGWETVAERIAKQRSSRR
jgi:hypothetical protein